LIIRESPSLNSHTITRLLRSLALKTNQNGNVKKRIINTISYICFIKINIKR